MLGRAIIIVTVLAFGLAPATALATPQDVASTHAYIRANYAFTRATEREVHVSEVKVHSLNEKFAQQCPDVGAGSPQNEDSQHLSYEVAVVLWSVFYGTDAGPIHTFANKVKRLRWSNHKLARLAQTYTTDLRALAALQAPDICSDVLAWKASNFKVVPAGTIQLDRRVEAIEPKTIPSSLLARYVQPADKGILATTARLETGLERTETVVGFDNWDMVLETLGLNQ
jgi:hypothetical protein